MSEQRRQAHRAALLEGSVGKALLGLTMPAMGGVLAIMVATLIDTWVSGRLGVAAQAAISFSFPLTFALSSVALGLAIGSTAAAGRMLGAGEDEAVGRFVQHALILALAITIGTGLLLWLLDRPIYKALGVTAETLGPLSAYMGPWLLSMPLLAIQMVGNSLLRAAGDTLTPSLVLGVIALGKAVLAPLLALHLGFGLAGAGWSTTLSMLAAALASLAALARHRWLLRPAWPDRTELLDHWRSILRIGFPSVLTNVLTPVTSGVAVKLLAPMGPAVVAGFGVGSRLESVALIPCFALSGVIGIFMAQNLGARQAGRMDEAMRLAIRLCLTYGLVVAVVLAVCAPWIAAPMTDEPATARAATQYLRLVPLTYGFYGVLMIVAGGFNGCGEPRANLVLYTIRSLLLFVPAVMIGAALGGFTGVCLGIGASNLAGGLAAWFWCRRHLPQILPAAAPLA